jgi:hypothetical protein
MHLIIYQYIYLPVSVHTYLFFLSFFLPPFLQFYILTR